MPNRELREAAAATELFRLDALLLPLGMTDSEVVAVAPLDFTPTGVAPITATA